MIRLLPALVALSLAGLAGAQSSLVVTAQVQLGELTMPYALPILVDGEEYVLARDGRLSIELEPGEYALEAVTGAAVEGPERVTVAGDGETTVHFRIMPRAEIELGLSSTELRVGEVVTLTARATTVFEGLLPLDFEIVLPPGLELLDNARLTAPLSAANPRELTVRARAAAKGTFGVRAIAHGLGAEAGDAVTVLQPATVELVVRAETSTATVLEEASWSIEVRNVGDDPAFGIELSAPVPSGMEGTALVRQIALAAGESLSFDHSGRVLQGAGEEVELIVEARLGPTVTTATSRLPVLRPQPVIGRHLPGEVFLAGEQIEVTLSVFNGGSADLSYELEDVVPEWLEVSNPATFRGLLPAGERVSHRYLGRVEFGPNTTGTFSAALRTDVGTFEERTQVQRLLVPVEVRLAEGAIRMGGSTQAFVKLANPGTQTVSLRLQASADAALRPEPLPSEVVLPAGESVELPVELQPDRPGTFRYEVTAFNSQLPASFPVGVNLLVVDPLAPRRTSFLSLPFTVRSASSAGELLVGHRLPEGASYVPGSSMVSGTPLDDPLVGDSDGAVYLYWRIPFQAEGELAYAVEHVQPLNDPTAADLTLLVDRREIRLTGDLTQQDYRSAAPLAVAGDTMIVEPRPGTIVRTSDQVSVRVEAPYPGAVQVTLNREPLSQRNLGMAEFDEVGGTQRLAYYGVQLAPGRNLLEAFTEHGREEVVVWLARAPTQLRLVPLALLADGSTPLAFELLAVDENGIENGFGALTVDSNVEPMTPDAFPAEAGHQVLLRDGRALLELTPISTVQRVVVTGRFNELEATRVFTPGGRGSVLAIGQGSIVARMGEGALTLEGAIRAYLEAPLAGGTLQAAVNTAEPLLPGGGESDRFPLTGAQGEAQPALQSLDGVALKYDNGSFSLGYHHSSLEVPGLSGALEGTVLQGSFEGEVGTGHSLSSLAFVGLLPDRQIVERIVPDGTRIYPLTRLPRSGTVVISKVIGEGPAESRERLVPSRDFVIDYPTGRVVLASPLWRTTPDFRAVALEVSYAPSDSVRSLFAGGAGALYTHPDGFSVAAGFMSGYELAVGARLGYRYDRGQFDVAFRHQGSEGSRIDLTGRFGEGGFQGNFSVRYELGPARLTAGAQARVALLDNLELRLEHRHSDNLSETTALLAVELGALEIGLGGLSDWRNDALLGVVRAGWSGNGITAELEHRQSFDPLVPSEVGFRTSVQLKGDLNLETDLSYRPGLGLDGSVDLIQEIGDGNLSVGYQLPGSSSVGNRARFGIEAPLPLDDHWTIDFSAGYEQELGTGEGEAGTGIGVRYRSDELQASLAADVSITPDANRVILRGGASGVVDEASTLSLDATMEVSPIMSGRVTLAHSYRSGEYALLHYHRLTFGSSPSVEGEAALTVHPAADWQLRPTVAYRVPLPQPDLALFQFSLGGSFYPVDDVSIGGAVHHLMQPGKGASQTGFTLEGGYQVLPGTWVSAGYTFLGFEGLTADSHGFHLRLDLLAGRQ